MKLLILRTDIKTKRKVSIVRPLFNKHPVIDSWSIDTEDIDNVLRIEAKDNLHENDIITMMKPYGFFAEPLPD